MARPMYLVAEHVLKTLYERKKIGMPYTALVRHHELPFTAPTLKKLINHYHLLTTLDGIEKVRVRQSLFPDWLSDRVQLQNSADYYYTGTMPTGRWVRR